MSICTKYLITITHKDGTLIHQAYLAGPLTHAWQDAYERLKILSYTKPLTGTREAHDVVVRVEGVVE